MYFQWLNYRGAWPMKLDKRAMPWLWGISILHFALVIFAVLNSNKGMNAYGPGSDYYLIMVIAGVFAFGLPVIFILFDLLVHVPRAIHDDTTSSILPAIMVTPVSTRSILRDLTTWAIRLNLRHLMPSLLVFTSLFISYLDQMINSGYELMFPPWLICLIYLFGLFLLAIPVVVLWRFLLITGLASAAFPRWVWSTGSSLFFWVVPVLSVVIGFMWWCFFVWEPWIGVLIALTLLEIITMLLARYLPDLMAKRRSGVWG